MVPKTSQQLESREACMSVLSVTDPARLSLRETLWGPTSSTAFLFSPVGNVALGQDKVAPGHSRTADATSHSLVPVSQFAAQLKSRVSPPFKQAPLEPHPLCGLDFCPTNCHVNLMEVSYPKTTPSVGRSFSIRFGRKPSLIGLDPEQGTCVCLLETVLDLTLQMRKQGNVQRPLSRMVLVAS